MRISRLTLALAVVMLVTAVFAAAASATTIRSGSSTGSPYTGSITASLTSGVSAKFTSGFVNITCNQSTISGSITNSNGTGNISSGSWTNNGGACPNNIGGSCTSTALNLNWNAAATYDAGGTGGRSGYMVIGATGNQMRVKADCTDSFGSHTICYYTGNNAAGSGANSLEGDLFNPVGTAAGQLKYPSVSDAANTNNLKLDTTQMNGFLCSSTAAFAATYDVTGAGGVHLWITA
jgi:hypothetical protein